MELCRTSADQERITYGHGWGISEQSLRVQLRQRWTDGSTISAMFDLSRDRSCIEEPVGITSIRHLIDEANFSIQEAASFQAEATEHSRSPSFIITSFTSKPVITPSL